MPVRGILKANTCIETFPELTWLLGVKAIHLEAFVGLEGGDAEGL